MSNPRVEKIKEELKKRNESRGLSPLEEWVQKWMELGKFYAYEVEYQVEFYFIDIAWPDKKFGVELDGYEFHKDRKERDGKRDAYLGSKGWRIKRIPSSECWNPKLLVFHLIDMHVILYPGVPIPFALAELADVDPRVPTIKVRKEYKIDDVNILLETEDRQSKFTSIGDML